MKKIKFTCKSYCEYVAQTLAEQIAENINEGDYGTHWDLYSVMCEEVERYTIYTSEQWEVLQAYCTPIDADYNEAIEKLLDEISDQLEEYELDEWEDVVIVGDTELNVIYRQLTDEDVEASIYDSQGNEIINVIIANGYDVADYLNDEDGESALTEVLEYLEEHN